MKKKYIDNVKLGLFVMSGVLFLILSLYLIGRNRNLFGATFTIKASFHHVNGLVPGGNVRFAGIDVGTVQKIEIMNDTLIEVTMLMDKKVEGYIKENAMATIGTDGLMGNKLININPRPGPAKPVEEGSVLQSLTPVETDEMLRTLNTTNDNIAVISRNLRDITNKLNSSNSLWTLLADSLIVRDVRQAVTDIRKTGHNTAVFTGRMNDLMKHMQQGEGLAGSMLTDTTVFSRLERSMQEIHAASSNMAALTGDLKQLVGSIEQGKGLAGTLVADTVLKTKLYQTLDNVAQGTARFNENMEAMRHHFLFRGYFRKQEKREEKE